jgi:hypothetical protein
LSLNSSKTHKGVKVFVTGIGLNKLNPRLSRLFGQVEESLKPTNQISCSTSDIYHFTNYS